MKLLYAIILIILGLVLVQYLDLGKVKDLVKSDISQFIGEVVPLPVVESPHLGAAGLQAIWNDEIKNDRNKKEVLRKYSVETVAVPIWSGATGTQSISIPAREVKVFDAEYLAQGVCLKIKDSDGSGYTYLSANNGVLSASQTSCE